MNFDAFEAVLLDLDGTVYHEEQPLPGAVQLVARLRADGRKFACLSNSTSSPQRIAARLNRMQIDIDPGHVFTAAAATVDYVLATFGGAGNGSENPHKSPRVFNLSTEGIEEMLQGKVHWVQSGAEPCDAVICG